VLKTRGLREERVRSESDAMMPFAETPQLLKSPHAYTLGPFCISVPATPIDVSDSVRHAYNNRPSFEDGAKHRNQV